MSTGATEISLHSYKVATPTTMAAHTTLSIAHLLEGSTGVVGSAGNSFKKYKMAPLRVESWGEHSLAAVSEVGWEICKIVQKM